MNKFTLILDSSQINCFLECPTLWYYQYVKRLILPVAGEKDDSSMDMGTYGHHLLAVYYRKRRLGISFNDAVEASFNFDIDNHTCSKCNCDVSNHKLIDSIKLYECQQCHNCLLPAPAPKAFPLRQDLRQKVKNRLREYFLKYQANDFTAVSPESVEVGFSEPIYEDSQNLFVLEGRIDLIGQQQGLDLLVDHKFQLRKHNLYKKSIQFRNYALIAKKLMLIINYVRLSDKANDDTLVRDIASFTVPELLDWKKKLIQIFFDIKEAIQTQNFDQNWSSCSGKYGYPCSFATLCEEVNKDVVQLKERQLYEVKTSIWRPW